MELKEFGSRASLVSPLDLPLGTGTKWMVFATHHENGDGRFFRLQCTMAKVDQCEQNFFTSVDETYLIT